MSMNITSSYALCAAENREQKTIMHALAPEYIDEFCLVALHFVRAQLGKRNEVQVAGQCMVTC